MNTKLTQFLLLSAIIALPLYVFRLKIYFFPTTILEILVLILAFSFLILKIKEDRKFFSGWPKTSFDFLILGFLIASFLAIFVSGQKMAALGIFRAYIAEPLIIFYIFVELSKRMDSQKIFLPLILAGSWIVILTILQGIFSIAIFTPAEAAQGRSTGVFNTGNAVALFLGPIFALTIANFLQTKNFCWRLFLISNIFGIIFGVFFSQSRAGIISILASLVFFLILTKFPFSQLAKFKVPILRLGLLFFIVASVFIALFDLTPKITTPEYSGGNTLLVRFFLWEGTAGLISDHPLFGAGLANFKPFYSANYVLPQYQEALEYPHNWFLATFAELGFLGAIFLTLIIFKFFKNLIETKNLLSVGLAMAMFYWLVHGLVDVPYFKNDLALEFWVMIGLSEVLRSKVNKRP